MSTATTRHVQITIGLTNHAAGPAARITNSLWQVVRAAKATLFAFNSIGKAVGYFIKINQQIEDLNLSFAGIIKAKGLADSFESAMNLSKTFVQEIRNQAGLLPGSLNQYVEIAKQSYSELSNAGFRTVQEQAKFIGQYGAVALTLQVPAAQAGRDLMHMLVGNVRATTRTWALLKNEIGATIKGWDKMDEKARSAAWKGLGTEGRRTAIQTALNQYTEMVRAAASTWDAAWGAFGTHVQDVARFFSESYFNGLKGALQSLNGALSTNKEFVASMLAMTLKLVGALLLLRSAKGRVADKFGMGFMDFLRGRVVMRNPLAGFAAGTKMKEMWVRAPLQGPSIGYGSGARRTPLMLGAGGQHNAIERYSPGVNWQWAGGARIDRPAWMNAGGKALRGREGPDHPYANLMKTQVPVPLTIIERLKTGIPLLLTAIKGLLNLTGWFVLALAVFKGIEAIVTNAKMNADDTYGITEYIADIWFRILSHFMTIGIELDQMFSMALPLALSELMAMVLTLVRVVSYLAKSAADLWMRVTSSKYTGYSSFEIWDSVLADEARAKEERDGILKKKTAAQTAATARGGSNVNFYNAKFNITQQFAEGFDPDRIAVAFADDLSALANRRLQSSFSPVGSM